MRHPKVWAYFLLTIGIGAAPFLDVDAIAVNVTVDQALTQDDPTNQPILTFVAIFSEPIVGFDEADVVVSGPTGGGGSSITEDAPFDGTVFAIRVDGMTQDGVVFVTIPAGAVESTTGDLNAASTSTDNAVLFDASSPPPPLNRNPANGSISNDPSPTLSWSAPEDPGESGVKNYRVMIDGPKTRNYYTPNASYSPTLCEGVFTWRINARDHAGNTGTWSPWWRLMIDATSPLNPTISSSTHTIGDWSTDPTVGVSAAGAWDALSGVSGFEIAWNRDPVWTGSGIATHARTWAGDTFDAPHDGEWWVHVATADEAGNWTLPTHFGPFRIDTTAPMISGTPGNLIAHAAPGETTTPVTWIEPTASDSSSGVQSFTSTHNPGDTFSQGTTTVTYTASDHVGHVTTTSFDVITHENPIVSAVPAGKGGDDAFLDRSLPLRPGEAPPTVGTLPLAAIYSVGDVISGSCALRSRTDELCTNAHVTLTLYAVTIEDERETRAPKSVMILPYDRKRNGYGFEIPTDELQPGYYDVRLRYHVGVSQWIRVNIQPATN